MGKLWGNSPKWSVQKGKSARKMINHEETYIWFEEFGGVFRQNQMVPSCSIVQNLSLIILMLSCFTPYRKKTNLIEQLAWLILTLSVIYETSILAKTLPKHVMPTPIFDHICIYYVYIIIYIVCIIYPDSSKLRNQTRLKKNTRNLQPCGVVWELFLYVFIPKFIGYISTSSDKLNLLLDNVWLWLKGHNWGYTPFSDTPILDPRPNRCGRLALSPEKFPGELVLGIFSMGI